MPPENPDDQMDHKMEEDEAELNVPEFSPPSGNDPRQLADEAARSLQGVLEEAGISDDVLRNVVDKVQLRGRGGRTPAGDPRLDPNIEPKKAKRILANRLSAAKSKMRQRVLTESLEMLKSKESLEQTAERKTSEELQQVKRMCHELQAKNKELEGRLRVLEAQSAIRAASGMHGHLAPGGPMRVQPLGYPPANAALLAALAPGVCGASGGTGARSSSRDSRDYPSRDRDRDRESREWERERDRDRDRERDRDRDRDYGREANRDPQLREGGGGGGGRQALPPRPPLVTSHPPPSSAFTNYINPRGIGGMPGHRANSPALPYRDSSPGPASWLMDYGAAAAGGLPLGLVMPGHMSLLAHHHAALQLMQGVGTEGQAHSREGGGTAAEQYGEQYMAQGTRSGSSGHRSAD